MVYLTDPLTQEATHRLFKPKILKNNKMVTPEEIKDRLAKAREPIKKPEKEEEEEPKKKGASDKSSDKKDPK